MNAEKETKNIDATNRDLYNYKYIPLLSDLDTRFLHLFGSAGSGKSRFAAQKELICSMDSRRSGRKTLGVRQTYSTIKDSMYSELLAAAHSMGWAGYFSKTVSPLRIINKITGVQFIFTGLDDVQKLKSIQGVDRAWVEEATEIQQMGFNQIDLRARGFTNPGVQITLSYNPINVFHWLNTEIHEKPEDYPLHKIFKTTFQDNRFLDDAYLDTLKSYEKTNPEFWKVYGLGEWGQTVEGLVLPDYRIGKFPLAEVLPGRFAPDIQFYGLDFGWNDPCALIAGSIQDPPESERRSYHVKELLYESKLTGDELAAKMKKLRIRKDLPIIADSARPEIIATLKQNGFNVKKCRKFKGSVMSGVNDLKLYDLIIDPASKNTLKEIRHWQFEEKDGQWLDKPNDTLNHAMDSLRYGLESMKRLTAAIRQKAFR